MNWIVTIFFFFGFVILVRFFHCLPPQATPTSRVSAGVREDWYATLGAREPAVSTLVNNATSTLLFSL
eukprot:m.52660 g.52660  ORF g.52660 m.52660 type:complete len:68 (-) comp16571_c2_seq1:21-224(-)